MTRNVILALAVLATTLLLVGGVVAGRPLVTCTGGKCRGTNQGDRIEGTTGNDAIAGRRGNDLIFGEEPDGTAGDDGIRGGAGNDTITDNSAADPDTDQIFGGAGDDPIAVVDNDGSVDVIDCGPGQDSVFADPTDTIANCERVNPPD